MGPYEEKYLELIKQHPGITSTGIWEALWGAGHNEHHQLKPEDCSPRLAIMTKSGIVDRKMIPGNRYGYHYWAKGEMK